MKTMRILTLALFSWAALAALASNTARADVVVTIFNGNPTNAGDGSAISDANFAGLSQAGTFNYYAPAFGIDAAAGNGFSNSWRPLYNSGVNFSARITGQINVASNGVYTFSTTSDDGSVLRIDGQVVVNNNFNQGATTRTGQVSLGAGVHNVEVLYYQGGGGRSLDVGSGSGSLVNQLPAGVSWVNHGPQVQANVYNGMRFDANTGAIVNPGTPLVGTITAPSINFGYATGAAWSPFGLQTNYSVDITGFLHVDANGNYTFGLNSDDGSFLFIDGVLVVNDGGSHGDNQTPPFGLPQVQGTANLTAGDHAFEVRYFQGTGGAGLNLYLPAGVTYTAPEPGSLALLGSAGVVGLAGFIRRRRKRVA